jgi:hypothetical protein
VKLRKELVMMLVGGRSGSGRNGVELADSSLLSDSED